MATERRRRTRRFLGARCMLLTVIGLGLSIPLFDQAAIERTPWHEHLVFGGTGAERIRALEAHLSGTVWSSGPTTDRPFAPPIRAGGGRQGEAQKGVSIVSTPGGLSAASIGIGAPGLAAPTPAAFLMTPSRTDQVFRFGSLMFVEALLSVPEPPPRSAA